MLRNYITVTQQSREVGNAELGSQPHWPGLFISDNIHMWRHGVDSLHYIRVSNWKQ